MNVKKLSIVNNFPHLKSANQGISINNQMAVRFIWDISSELFFINFEINPSVSEGDLKIDEKITRVLYPKFHVVKLAG